MRKLNGASRRSDVSRLAAGRPAARTRTAVSVRAQASLPTREVLTSQQRMKMDMSSDTSFYSQPRFCNHAGDNFIRSLKGVYRQYLGQLQGDNVVVLDLGSSHVSHVPDEISGDKRYKFIGHGMNAQELARNPILGSWFVRDFNADPPSPTSPLVFEDDSLDAVLCCCSIQYFQYPEQIFAEIRRVLKPGGICLVSFTNRAFWNKAISAWGNTSEYGRVQLVKQYFVAAGFSNPELAVSPETEGPTLVERIKSLFSDGQSDSPFYCVCARKDE